MSKGHIPVWKIKKVVIYFFWIVCWSVSYITVASAGDVYIYPPVVNINSVGYVVGISGFGVSFCPIWGSGFKNRKNLVARQSLTTGKFGEKWSIARTHGVSLFHNSYSGVLIRTVVIVCDILSNPGVYLFYLIIIVCGLLTYFVWKSLKFGIEFGFCVCWRINPFSENFFIEFIKNSKKK